jgi:hypothetical protein
VKAKGILVHQSSTREVRNDSKCKTSCKKLFQHWEERQGWKGSKIGMYFSWDNKSVWISCNHTHNCRGFAISRICSFKLENLDGNYFGFFAFN